MKLLAKLIVPLLVLAFGAYSYFSTISNNKFAELFNAHGEVTSVVFKDYGDTALEAARAIMQGDTEAADNIKLSKESFDSASKLTEDMLENGCPMLTASKAQCIDINTQLLQLLSYMHEGNTKEYSVLIKKFNEEFPQYIRSLKENEGIGQ